MIKKELSTKSFFVLKKGFLLYLAMVLIFLVINEGFALSSGLRDRQIDHFYLVKGSYDFVAMRLQSIYFGKRLHSIYLEKKGEGEAFDTLLIDGGISDRIWTFSYYNSKKERVSFHYAPTKIESIAMQAVRNSLKNSEQGSLFAIRIKQGSVEFITSYGYSVFWKGSGVLLPQKDHFTERLSFHWHHGIYKR